MKHFTKEQIEEIRIQLATKAVRDSDFDVAESLADEDLIPILQDGVNKTAPAQLVKDNVINEIRQGVDGKVLSSNDYTDAEKEKLAGIAAGAQVNAPYTVVDPLYVHTDNNYTTPEKTKLRDIAPNAQVNVIEAVKVNGTELPAIDKKVNVEVPDVSQFITKSVNDLVNYYRKSEVYTKEEVDYKIIASENFHYEIYASIQEVTQPAPNILYLIGPLEDETEGENKTDRYQEWVYSHDEWVQIGDTSIDLSDYITTAKLNTALAAYQEALVSGTNIKTVNGQSIVGSGNLEVGDLNAIKFISQTLTDGQKTQARTNIEAGTYSKPSGGIPKTDLASGVQASLELADSAIQAEPVGSVTPAIDPYTYATKSEVSQLGQEVNGVGTKSYPGQLRNNGTIKDTAGVTYRVWSCKGGDVVRFQAPTSMRFYVVSEFQFNPVLPYTLVLATGETGEHTTADGSTVYSITLPQDAAYIVINNINPTLFEINGRDVFQSIQNLAVQAKEEIDKRIWIIVGQGSWQAIGKTDWKVGDRWFGYNAPVDDYYIMEATSVSGGGTTVSSYSPVRPAPQDALYMMDGHFYTYKGGEVLVRLNDISEIYTAIGTLSNLATAEKTSVVGAVNEVVNTIIGSLSGLNTTNKSSVVSAINELVGKFFDSSSEIQSVRDGKYWNTGSLSVGSDFTGNSKNLATQCSADIVSVQEGDVYKFYGIGSNSSQIKTYVITDSSDKVLVISNLTTGADYRTTPFDIVIPENGAKLYVNFSVSYDSTTDKLVKFVNREISIPGLDARVSALETDVTELQKLPWYGKTIVCFGDSITEFSVTGKKRYSDYLADITGANVINVGVGGSRLQQRTTPVDVPTTQLQAGAALDIVNMVKASCEQVFTQQVAGVNWLYDNTGRDIRDVVTRLQSIDWSAVDAVTIFGGTNDWTGNNGDTGTANSTEPDTTLGALNYMLRLITYTYPKVRVFFFTPPIRGFDENLNGSNGAFAPSHTYEIGEDAFYNGILWRFTAQHTGVWSDADARRITQAELDAMSSDVQLQNGTTLLQFSRLLIPVAEQNHIPVCDLYTTLWNIYQFPSVCHADFTHPLNGMEQIAEKFYGFISTNRNFDM